MAVIFFPWQCFQMSSMEINLGTSWRCEQNIEAITRVNWTENRKAETILWQKYHLITHLKGKLYYGHTNFFINKTLEQNTGLWAEHCFSHHSAVLFSLLPLVLGDGASGLSSDKWVSPVWGAEGNESCSAPHIHFLQLLIKIFHRQ